MDMFASVGIKKSLTMKNIVIFTIMSIPT